MKTNDSNDKNRRKVLACLASLLIPPFFSWAESPITLEDISPHLSTNTQITWRAPTDNLPKSFWIYKKLPQTFSAVVISNALVLASIQRKSPILPSTNRLTIWDKNKGSVNDPLAGHFSIIPDFAELSYFVRAYVKGSSENIPNDEAIVKRTWECAFQLGLDRAQLVENRIENQICEYDDKGKFGTNLICGRLVFLARRINGIEFRDADEGFWITFGNQGKIKSFSVVWPELEPFQIDRAASQEQIVNCIKAYKTAMCLEKDGSVDWAKLKKLEKARKFIITKITPYYGEGKYGEVPKDNELLKFVFPFAELETIAELSETNLNVRLFSPILASDAIDLLKGRNK